MCIRDRQDPEQHRQPAESGCLDGPGDRAGAGNGRKLMAENGPAVGGDIVLAILMGIGRGFCSGVDAPFVGKPAAVKLSLIHI